MSENTQALEKSTQRETRLMVEDTTNLSFFIDTAKFEQAQRIAKLMAAASLMPKHLKGASPEEAIANSFLVVNQAFTWGVNPFAVAKETYVVQGNLGYQGKLVAAIINTKARLKERLRYEYNDQPGDKLEITVIGTFQGESEPRKTSLSVGQARTQNQMWSKDPRQKLIYSGAIKWARAHAPELILGVATDDDIDRMMEAPKISSEWLDRHEEEKPKPVSRVEQAKQKLKASPKDKPLTDQVLDLCDRDNVQPANVHAWMTANEPSYAGSESLLDAPQKVLSDLIKAWDDVRVNFVEVENG
jgi:hypothetical protein